MSKKIFVSFKYSELEWKNNIESLFHSEGAQVAVTPVWLSIPAANTPRISDTEIRKAIRDRVDACCGLIVVVGNDAHNSPWIDYELGLANALKKPKVAVRHPQATGGLPNNHKGMIVLAWKSDDLMRAIQSW